MTFLLDTHVFLWWQLNDARLSESARRVLKDTRNNILVSSVSAFEIANKHRLGKLETGNVDITDWGSTLREHGLNELNLTGEHAVAAGLFAMPHRDPFDRLLAAQSMIESIPLVTRDPVFSEFDIEVFW